MDNSLSGELSNAIVTPLLQSKSDAFTKEVPMSSPIENIYFFNYLKHLQFILIFDQTTIEYMFPLQNSVSIPLKFF